MSFLNDQNNWGNDLGVYLNAGTGFGGASRYPRVNGVAYDPGAAVPYQRNIYVTSPNEGVPATTRTYDRAGMLAGILASRAPAPAAAPAPAVYGDGYGDVANREFGIYNTGLAQQREDKNLAFAQDKARHDQAMAVAQANLQAEMQARAQANSNMNAALDRQMRAQELADRDRERAAAIARDQARYQDSLKNQDRYFGLSKGTLDWHRDNQAAADAEIQRRAQFQAQGENRALTSDAEFAKNAADALNRKSLLDYYIQQDNELTKTAPTSHPGEGIISHIRSAISHPFDPTARVIDYGSGIDNSVTTQEDYKNYNADWTKEQAGINDYLKYAEKNPNFDALVRFNPTTGKYEPAVTAPTQPRVPVIAPNGQRFTVPQAQLPALLRSGRGFRTLH